MSLTTEWRSWQGPSQLDIAVTPQVGEKAPSTDLLSLPFKDGKAAVVVFLRHCGCPFAEKAFLALRSAAKEHPDLHFIAVSHSDEESTEKWINAVGGSHQVSIIVDPERTLYARWGLGVSSWSHVLSFGTFSSIYRLWKDEGIKNRPTESGNRWQTGGCFVVDGTGKVVYGRASHNANDVPDIAAAVKAVKRG